MTDLIIVGGFLGAGKTTLLWTLARKFSETGKKVGLITNDQAAELVDTVFLESTGGVVKEVSGSCFCCNFNGLAGAIAQCVESDQVDTIIAEPVGSCTDLSATIMQPLKEQFGGLIKIHPLNVLADLDKIQSVVCGEDLGIHESSLYIFKKQLEEADYIVINKTETLSQDQKEVLNTDVKNYFSKEKVYLISALMEEGIDQWLDEMVDDKDVGVHMADVDYDIYAEGEAVLGWLNATLSLHGKETNWGSYLKQLMGQLEEYFINRGMAVGHVKALLKKDKEIQIANITGNNHTLKIKGEDIIADKAVMTLNARVESTPQQLEALIRQAISDHCPVGGKITIEELNCLQPGRPEPTHRYSEIYSC